MQNRSPLADTLLFVLIVLACVGGLSAIWKVRFANQLVPDVRPITKEVVKPQAPDVTASSTNQRVAAPLVTPPGMMCDEESVICVSSSTQNMALENPFVLTGVMRGDIKPEQISLEIFDKNGRKLTKSFSVATSTAGDGISFTLRAFMLGVATSTAGALTVGVEQTHTQKIPVRFEGGHTRIVWYEIGQSTSTKEGVIPQTKLPVEAVLRAYMAQRGPDNATGQLQDLSVKKGVATVVFGELFQEEFDGDTRHLAEASITKTLQRFSSIKQVVFVWP